MRRKLRIVLCVVWWTISILLVALGGYALLNGIEADAVEPIAKITFDRPYTAELYAANQRISFYIQRFGRDLSNGSGRSILGFTIIWRTASGSIFDTDYRILVEVPAWFPIILGVICPFFFIRRHLAKLRKQRGIRLGLCPVCGYDLRASKERCPECGTPIAAKAE